MIARRQKIVRGKLRQGERCQSTNVLFRRHSTERGARRFRRQCKIIHAAGFALTLQVVCSEFVVSNEVIGITPHAIFEKANR